MQQSLPQRTTEQRGATSSHARHEGPWRATRLALAFVAVVLVANLVVPLVMHRRLDAIRSLVSEVAEPAREAGEVVSRSLADEVAADRAFELTGQARFRTQFVAAWGQQEHAFGVLARLAPDLGPDVIARTADLRDAVRAWAALPLAAFTGRISTAARRSRLDSQERLFERTVAAAAALDDAIRASADRERGEASRIGFLVTAVTAALSALALLALAVVTWLARLLRHIAQEQSQLRAELQTLFSARDRLIRGFSHDVKNPLGAADGIAALLEAGMIGEAARQREALARIRRSIRSALKLIDDVLELARAEAGQLQLVAAPVNIGEVAADIAEQYRAQAEAAGMSLSVDCAADLPAFRSDSGRIHQILGNLISNAIKYAGSGGAVGLRIRAEPRWSGGRAADWVRVEVWDRGPGIPADLRERIFDEYTRFDKQGKEGAGLGLAISRRLAHALGGELVVESQHGAGSRFVLWLPASAAAAA